MSICILERRDALISGIGVYAALMLLLSQFWLSNPDTLGIMALAALLMTITGFMIHELSHRYVARELGYIACFRLVKAGLAMLAISALIGFAARVPFILGAPGAVMIGPNIMGKDSSRNRALVALAGPSSNVVSSIVFYAASRLITGNVHLALILVGIINAYFALINSIPIPPLDGFQVVKNREFGMWMVLMASSIMVFVLAIETY